MEKGHLGAAVELREVSESWSVLFRSGGRTEVRRVFIQSQEWPQSTSKLARKGMRGKEGGAPVSLPESLGITTEYKLNPVESWLDGQCATQRHPREGRSLPAFSPSTPEVST